MLEDSPSSRAKAYVLSNLSRFRMIADKNEEAIRVGFEALQMAEELGLEELRAHALNNIGIARAGIGDPGGVVDLEKSIAIAVELNSLESVRGYVNLGTTLAEFGDLERAFDLYEQGGVRPRDSVILSASVGSNPSGFTSSIGAANGTRQSAVRMS